MASLSSEYAASFSLTPRKAARRPTQGVDDEDQLFTVHPIFLESFDSHDIEDEQNEEIGVFKEGPDFGDLEPVPKYCKRTLDRSWWTIAWIYR